VAAGAAHGALTEVELAAEPLDRVREQERAGEENGEARREQDDRAHAQTVPRTAVPKAQ
jgi:hypothetical protein